MKQIFILMISCILLGTSCIETINNFDKLPPGIWRGELVLDSKSFTPIEGEEEVQRLERQLDDSSIPFNFEVKYDENNAMVLYFINGEERIKADQIDWGRNRSIAKDSFRIHFPIYDTYIRGSYEDNALEGHFVNPNKKDYRIPFRAVYGKKYRFTPLKKEPVADLTGMWECTFSADSDRMYKAIGEFKQVGNTLTGTFRTETGDYRYLDGTIQGNRAYLSVFDGSHAYLFTMNIKDKDHIIGGFRAGQNYRDTWTGVRNAAFKLGDPSKLTYVTDATLPVKFSGIDIHGKSLNETSPRFKNKPSIVSVMGTWCPNCKDEMRFFNELKSSYGDQIEIVALSFERYREQEKCLQSIQRYAKQLELTFPILYAGKASKTAAADMFPQLNKIMSFPTILLLDKDKNIKYVHTGFNGPATSKYKAFKKHFNEELKALL